MKNQILMIVVVMFSFIVFASTNSQAAGRRPGGSSGGTNSFTCTNTKCTCDISSPAGEWASCKGMAKACKALGTDTIDCTYTIGKKKVTKTIKIGRDGRDSNLAYRGGNLADHRKPKVADHRKPKVTDHRKPKVTDHRTDRYNKVDRTKKPAALIPGECVCKF